MLSACYVDRLLAGLLFLWSVGPRQGGALTLAYFVGLSLIHMPGVLAFLGGPSADLGKGEQTRIGFELTLLGMGAFVIGAVAARTTAVEQLMTTKKSRWKRGTCLAGLVGGW